MTLTSLDVAIIFFTFWGLMWGLLGGYLIWGKP